jgi:uncharacterized repeat protein (TIGR02543 family)
MADRRVTSGLARLTRIVAVKASSCALAAAALALAGSASAAPVCPTGPPSVGQTITCTYGSGSTTIAVVVGTASLAIDLMGGGGGGGVYNGVVVGAAGGVGARVEGGIDASALGSITIVVGAGGARGASDPAGRGGGFSAIYSGGAVDPARVIAVAGGGGGGAGGWGAGSSGGPGGVGANGFGGQGNNNAGQSSGGHGGGGGTGGAGGCDGSTCGAAGATWAAGGGGGGTSSNADGDGGAGYGGGGEGAASGGGAGGSFVEPALRVGAPTFSPGGGAAGGAGTGWPSYAPTTDGAPGTVTITFVARTLTVGYHANGATGGTLPASAGVAYGSSLTVPGNTGNLERPGQAFAGWNTQAAGTGTAYAPGESLVVTEGVTLYAQWTPIAPAGTASSGAGPGQAAGSPTAVAPRTRLAGRFALSKGVGTTTGTVPPGATVVVQTVGGGGGVTGGVTSMATRGFLEMAKAARGTCRITTVRSRKTRKVTRRTYRCTVRLSKGSWTVTTTALGPAGVVAQGTRRVVVR